MLTVLLMSAYVSIILFLFLQDGGQQIALNSQSIVLKLISTEGRNQMKAERQIFCTLCSHAEEALELG